MNFITKGSTITLTLILAVLATILVFARLRYRRKVKKLQMAAASVVWGSYMDDIFCLLAFLFVIPTSTIIVWGASKGAIGTHSLPEDVELWITTVTPKWVNLSKVVWSVLFLQPFALGCIKLSALFFYRRIFMGKAFDIISWMTIAFVAAWMGFFGFALFFDCGTNIAANWGSLAEISEKCWFGFLPTIVYTILDACFDLFIVLLPIPFVWELQSTTAKKLSICACLSFGGLATAAAFIRMSIFIQSGIPSAALNKDYIMGLPTYDVVGIVGAEMFWTMIETNIALIAICLPTFRKLISITAVGKTLGLSSVASRFYAAYRSTGSGKSSHGVDSRLTDIELGHAEEWFRKVETREDKKNSCLTSGVEELDYASDMEVDQGLTGERKRF